MFKTMWKKLYSFAYIKITFLIKMVMMVQMCSMKYYRYYRSWMHDRLYPGRRALKPNFEEGVKGFITWAFAQEYCRSEREVRCSCLKCECRFIISDPEEVECHLKRKGFIANYWVWTYNGEELPSNIPETANTHVSSSRAYMEYDE